MPAPVQTPTPTQVRRSGRLSASSTGLSSPSASTLPGPLVSSRPILRRAEPLSAYNRALDDNTKDEDEAEFSESIPSEDVHENISANDEDDNEERTAPFELPSTEEESCAICLDSLSDIINKPILTLHGAHIFHVACIALLRVHQGVDIRCPLCRVDIPSPKVLYNQGCTRFIALVEGEALPQGSWIPTTELQKVEMSAIIEIWKSSALQGDSRSQFILGKVYATATGVIADLSESIKWYEMSGRQGNHDACLNLANLFYVGGAAIEKDYNRALEWYLKAAEAGSAQAQFKLANLLYKGLHVDINFPKAFEWYSKAAEQNVSQALYMLGCMHLSGKGGEVNYLKAIECFEKASGEGLYMAHFKLGNIYYFGHGVDQNYDKAFLNYEKSAQKSYANAQLMMGVMCYFGQGTVKSYQEAARWYQLAAEQNNATAQLKLGSFYYAGRGMKKDYAQAIVYYKQAAELGSAEAFLLLGNMHYTGKGFTKDIDQALVLYKKSGELNNSAAQNMLGNINFEGQGKTQRNYEAAHDYFLKAASQGHLQATLSLANMYFHGQHKGKNMIEAKRWYLEAANKGNSLGQLSIGHISLGNEDYSSALTWYTLAAAQGQVEALFNLGYLHFKGLGIAV